MSKSPPSPAERENIPVAGDSYHTLQRLTFELLEAAQNEILILSYALDPRLYNNKVLADLLLSLIHRNAYCKMQILISDLDSLRHGGHQFLAFAQRFPSFMEIRLQGQATRSNRHEWLIVDTRSVLCRDSIASKEALFSRHDRRWAIQLGRDFSAMWNSAEKHPDLRRLAYF